MDGSIKGRMLYVMTKPPCAVADYIAGHPRRARSRPAALLHMTVQPILDLMNYPLAMWDGIRSQIISLCNAIEADPFSISLDRVVESTETVGLRGVRRPAGATALQRAVRRMLGRGQWPLPDYRFDPHVTIAYRPDGKGSGLIDPIAWEVADIRLIESVVGQARHEELGCWPLQRRQFSLFG